MISLASITLSGSLPAHDFQFAYNSSNTILTRRRSVSTAFHLRRHASDSAFLASKWPQNRVNRVTNAATAPVQSAASLLLCERAGQNSRITKWRSKKFAVKYPLQIAAWAGESSSSKITVSTSAGGSLGKTRRLCFVPIKSSHRAQPFFANRPDDLSSGGCRNSESSSSESRGIPAVPDFNSTPTRKTVQSFGSSSRLVLFILYVLLRSFFF